MPAKKRGRKPGPRKPYKFDKIKKAAYLEQLRSGGRRHASARAIGISPALVCLAMKSDEAFRSAVDDAECEADAEVEDALRTAAISGNVAACCAWLYSRQPERWSDTRKQDVSKELHITFHETSDPPPRD